MSPSPPLSPAPPYRPSEVLEGITPASYAPLLLLKATGHKCAKIWGATLHKRWRPRNEEFLKLQTCCRVQRLKHDPVHLVIIDVYITKYFSLLFCHFTDYFSLWILWPVCYFSLWPLIFSKLCRTNPLPWLWIAFVSDLISFQSLSSSS